MKQSVIPPLIPKTQISRHTSTFPFRSQSDTRNLPKTAKWPKSIFWEQYKHCSVRCKVAICLRSYKNNYRVLPRFAGRKSGSLQTMRITIQEQRKILPQPEKRKTSLHRCTRTGVSFSHSSPLNSRSKLGGGREKRAGYEEWDSYFVCSSKNRRCAGFILARLCNGGGCCLQTTSTVRELRLLNSTWIFFKSLLRQSCWQPPPAPLLHPLRYPNSQDKGEEKPRKPAGPNTLKLAGDSLLHFEK